MKHFYRTLAAVLSLAALQATAQDSRKDKAEFKEKKNEFYDQIQKGMDAFYTEKKEPRKSLAMDYTGIDLPKSASEFKSVWSVPPVSQGITGTCWCFSTTSFYESEIYRLSKREIRLSELYTVYWQYVEKAREYVKTRGKSVFGEGSETNAVQLMMKKYGLVPHEAYTGIKPGQPFIDHSKMFEEMESYLKKVKETYAWNEEQVVSTIKSILNHYMGEPPVAVSVEGKKMTPVEYMKNVTKLNPDDYVDFMSLMEKPFWTQAEYNAPDNWWHSADYYNVPVTDFMTAVKTAIKNGYSLSIGGDVSESGIDSKLGVAMVPTFDIPSNYIDDAARQLRWTNGTTTDDHALHLVGYLEKPNGTWFLIKDSGSGGHNNQNSKGYYYYHEDFVKLKMMSFTVHKDAVKDMLAKFPKKS
jgi:bleomycin hydrolase